MSEVTRILWPVESDDPSAADRLLPLVYDELRKLAAAKLAREKAGQTLTPTALVHEAYLRLVVSDPEAHWNGRGHFFAAAAEAMRRILIENARRKKQEKRGGDCQRLELGFLPAMTEDTPDRILVLNEALEDLEALDPEAGRLFKLRYFTGCSMDEAAEAVGVSPATAYRRWAFARAWLISRIHPDG